MSKKSINLINAIKDNMLVSIHDVASGIKCGCVCPSCGEALIAKKGQKMSHHFAHASGKTCEYGYETSLHLTAKELLSKSKSITVPAVYLNFQQTNKHSELISESMEIKIDHVELEMQTGTIIPDVVVYSGKKHFFIEIFVTHKTDNEKLVKIKSLDTSTIEIDLSKFNKAITTEELRDILLSDNANKKWIYNSISNKWYNKFFEVSETLQPIKRGLASHVDYCPLKMRVWKGKPYANLVDDCFYCDYCIHVTEDEIICSGKSRIALIKDFDIPEEERIKKDVDKADKIVKVSLKPEKCPNCGGKLILRDGKYGKFKGCANYPKCNYTTHA